MRRDGGPIPHDKLVNYSGTGSTVTGFFKIMRSMDYAYLNHEDGSSKSFSREMMRG